MGLVYANETPEQRRKHQERSRRWRSKHQKENAAGSLAFYKKRVAFVAAIKDAPCTDCGQQFPPECMDFDHVRGTKIDHVNSLLQRSLRTLQAEIEKCELVCANCHRIRTKKRRTLELIAGRAEPKDGYDFF
jgi:hypothetical protein